MKKLLLVLLFLCFSPVAFAKDEQPAIKINWLTGPKLVTVASGLASINLPKDFLFADEKDTKNLMKYFGNRLSDQEIGSVFPNDESKQWFVIFDYDPMGYVKDDEGKKIDGDKLLKQIKEATEESNKEKSKQGLGEIKIIGWQVAPHYDEKTHNLVWAILAESNGHKLLNYKTKVLGRYGVTSITLVSNLEELESIKPQLDKIVASYTYNKGKSYADYVPGKDKVAQIGLTALVAGGLGAAAVKTGILAKILLSLKGMFWFAIVGLKKLWILIIAGIGALFRKLFGGKPEASENNSESENNEQNPPAS